MGCYGCSIAWFEGRQDITPGHVASAISPETRPKQSTFNVKKATTTMNHLVRFSPNHPRMVILTWIFGIR